MVAFAGIPASRDDPRYKTGRWKALTQKIMERDHGACVICGADATGVDHILAVVDGGEFFDPKNLRALCQTHHNAKTWEDRLSRKHDYASCTTCGVVPGMEYDLLTNTHYLDL